MSNFVHGAAAAAAKEREKAVARSVALTSLFDRLAAADARVRRRGSIEIDDVSEEEQQQASASNNLSDRNRDSPQNAGVSSPSPLRNTRAATRRANGVPTAGHVSGHGPSSTAPPTSTGGATAPSAATAASRPPHGPVLLRNGRAVVLSAGSRRLPPPFQEQGRVLTGLANTTSEVQGTLQLLHRDLAVHSRGRHTHANGGSTGSHSNNANYNTGFGSPSPHLRQLHRGSNGGDSPTSSGGDFNPHHSSSGRGGGGGGGFTSAGSATITAAAQRRMAAEEAKVEKLRIQRARAAAADEGASDDQSVEDYGVDCEIPPLTAESRLESEVAAIAGHFTKAKASALAMAEVEALAPTASAAPWWSSALRLRDMKAAAARLDYHARAALGWSYRAREQLLLQVAHLNNVSGTTRTQLLQQQAHWQEFQTRLKDGQQAVTQMQASIALWQAQAQEEARHRTHLQEALIQRAKDTAVVDSAEVNPLKAELALLLVEREWPTKSLQRDAQTVLEWLKSASTPLE